MCHHVRSLTKSIGVCPPAVETFVLEVFVEGLGTTETLRLVWQLLPVLALQTTVRSLYFKKTSDKRVDEYPASPKEFRQLGWQHAGERIEIDCLVRSLEWGTVEPYEMPDDTGSYVLVKATYVDFEKQCTKAVNELVERMRTRHKLGSDIPVVRCDA